MEKQPEAIIQDTKELHRKEEKKKVKGTKMPTRIFLESNFSLSSAFVYIYSLLSFHFLLLLLLHDIYIKNHKNMTSNFIFYDFLNKILQVFLSYSKTK